MDPAPGISTDDLNQLMLAEVKHKGIAGHHIESMNDFYRIGLPQIITDVFNIEDNISYGETGGLVKSINFNVKFKNVRLKKPMFIDRNTGKWQMLTPNMARLRNLTYSCQTYADIEVWANVIMADGTVKMKTDKIDEVKIAAVPCMVRSIMCHTYDVHPETLLSIEEDPNDVGGYFIIKGNEWIIDGLENQCNNMFHVYKNMYKTEIARGEFWPKPGDWYENSYRVILRYLNTHAITVEYTTRGSEKIEVPFFVMFKMLGIQNDKDIVEMISYADPDTPDEELNSITQHIMDSLNLAWDADYKWLVVDETRAELIKSMSSSIYYSKLAKTNPEMVKYIITNYLSMIDKTFLPHMGEGPEHRVHKAMYLAHLINKLIQVEFGSVQPSDRDAYRSKRIHVAGVSLAKAFKTSFNLITVQEIRKKLKKAFGSNEFEAVSLKDTVFGSLNTDVLEKYLAMCIVTGQKKITIKRAKEITNRISSQNLNRKSDINVISMLNTITSSNTMASGKTTERSNQMRLVHPTFIGYIDITQSPETGDTIGINKQLAISASVCGAGSSYNVIKTLKNDPDITVLDDIKPMYLGCGSTEAGAGRGGKVFVNGIWVGWSDNTARLATKYRKIRREGGLNRYCSIVWDILTTELHFWVDVGRLKRPLLIVYWKTVNGVEMPYITLTPKHLQDLSTGAITMENLESEGVIEYITSEEQENMLLAYSLNVIRDDVKRAIAEGDNPTLWTHCDVETSIFGIITLSSPLANHSEPHRITLFTSQRKQSVTWYALNWPYRMGKLVCLQYYCERPLVSTISDEITYPNGQNCIVALSMHGGDHQEDSIKINKSSIDAGLFNMCHFDHKQVILENNEEFGNDDFDHTLNVKMTANYEKCEGGYIRAGSIATAGDVLVIKRERILKPKDKYLWIDRSIVHKGHEDVFIESSIMTYNQDDQKIIKIKKRSVRHATVGDKLSSRMGNKGIICRAVDKADMPYAEDGTVPDIVVNCQSLPTRMAVNQLIECTLAQLAVKLGSLIDGTAFRTIDVYKVIEQLSDGTPGRQGGVKTGGYKRMFDGMTGEFMDTLVFVGPTTYQRLEKFAVDACYAVDKFAVSSALTHQPLAGLKKDGGMRIGEMEKDVICTHGTMSALYEKFNTDSDGCYLYICNTCGTRAIVNEEQGVYRCVRCEASDSIPDISKVDSAWVTGLWFHELMALGVEPRFTMDR